ncbi:MAG: sugar nucleotide-binding protein [Candidatus Woesearchaeota archaeon]|nr:sugar nucleotide-binding protein [Candidatus Woesearchaeota archaeon]
METEKIVVLGAAGMLGSAVFRSINGAYGADLTAGDRISPFDARTDSCAALLDEMQPAAVINCIGLLQEHPDLMKINGNFPHELAACCTERNIRLIHMSTDGVFSGKRGNYTEEETPDATDPYGLSKIAGEIGAPHLTVRTSIVAKEGGLLKWFLDTPEKTVIRGHTGAMWNGLTTTALARIFEELAVGTYKDVTGLLHIGGEIVSKYELLCKCKEVFQHDVQIQKDDAVRCNRSLAHERMDALGIVVPSVNDMLREL